MSDESTTSSESQVDTSAAEGQEQSQDTNQPAPKPKSKAPSFQKFKIGDEEVTLTQADIERDYKKWKGSDAKFREVSAKEKAVNDFFDALQKDPEKILSDKRLPLNKKALAEKWLVEQIEAELNPVDPRESALEARERKVREFEEAREREAREAQEAEEAETKSQAMNQRKSEISKTLATAMEATQLSKHPESAAATLREMAMYMRAAKERGEEPTPDEIVEHIHNTKFHQFYTLAHSMDGDDLIEFLSEDIVNKIRKADLARLRNGRQTQQYRSSSQESPRSDKPRETVDPSDFRMKLRDWK